MLMPNTWQIGIFVSGILNIDQEAPDAQNMNPDQLRRDEGYNDLSHIDIFMKPLKSRFGNIGFGIYTKDGMLFSEQFPLKQTSNLELLIFDI